MLSINKEDLSSIFRKIEEKLGYVDSVKLLDIDAYWCITPPECYDMHDIPQPEVGSLCEDLEQLLALVREDRAPMFLDLERMASLLNAISHSVNPIREPGANPPPNPPPRGAAGSGGPEESDD